MTQPTSIISTEFIKRFCTKNAFFLQNDYQSIRDMKRVNLKIHFVSQKKCLLHYTLEKSYLDKLIDSRYPKREINRATSEKRAKKFVMKGSSLEL